MKKIIGLVANYGAEHARLYLNQNYINYFALYGWPVLIDPLSDEVEKVDLLVMPGGADINPMRYGVPYDINIGMPNLAYERFDHYMIQEYINAGIPIFGICRGFQSLNVHFGGTLNPDNETHPNSMQDGLPVHGLCGEDDSEMMESSSNHHQTVDVLGEDLKPLLWAHSVSVQEKEVKIGPREHVEAFVHNQLKVAGVQWHPEKNFFSYRGKPTCKKAEKFVNLLINKLMAD